MNSKHNINRVQLRTMRENMRVKPLIIDTEIDIFTQYPCIARTSGLSNSVGISGGKKNTNKKAFRDIDKKPISVDEAVKAHRRFNLKAFTNNDVRVILYSKSGHLTINGVKFPLLNGTIDLRTWNKPLKTTKTLNESDKDKIKEQNRERAKRYRENKKNRKTETVISSNDYLSINTTNRIGNKSLSGIFAGIELKQHNLTKNPSMSHNTSISVSNGEFKINDYYVFGFEPLSYEMSLHYNIQRLMLKVMRTDELAAIKTEWVKNYNTTLDKSTAKTGIFK